MYWQTQKKKKKEARREKETMQGDENFKKLSISRETLEISVSMRQEQVAI